MDSALTQLGVGGIFAILVLKQVFEFIDKRKQNGNGSKSAPCQLREPGRVEGQLDELHRWHRPDSSGRQSWKNGDLIEAVHEMQRTLSVQTEALRLNTEATRESLRDIRRDVKSIIQRAECMKDTPRD